MALVEVVIPRIARQYRWLRYESDNEVDVSHLGGYTPQNLRVRVILVVCVMIRLDILVTSRVFLTIRYGTSFRRQMDYPCLRFFLR